PERPLPACDRRHPVLLVDATVIQDEHRAAGLIAKLEAHDRDVLAGPAPVELEHALRLERPDGAVDAVAFRELERERSALGQLHVPWPAEPPRERSGLRQRLPDLGARRRIA